MNDEFEWPYKRGMKSWVNPIIDRCVNVAVWRHLYSPDKRNVFAITASCYTY